MNVVLSSSQPATVESRVGEETVGCSVGSGVGCSVGSGVGCWVGSGVGCSVGSGVGSWVGSGVGRSVGLGLGCLGSMRWLKGGAGEVSSARAPTGPARTARTTQVAQARAVSAAPLPRRHPRIIIILSRIRAVVRLDVIRYALLIVRLIAR